MPVRNTFLDVPLASSLLFPHHGQVANSEDLRRAGHAVASRRGELRMTQQDLADKAGIDLKTVYNLESGTRWPIAKNRAAIAAALGWEPDALSALVSGDSPTQRSGPVARPELDFSGDDREGLHPWRQEVLREAYMFVGLAGAFGPGDVPEPSELPRVAETLAMLPPSRRPFRAAPTESATWDDPDLTLNEKLDLIAVMRRLGAETGEREHRRTGLAVG